jgi:hypothetical protein
VRAFLDGTDESDRKDALWFTLSTSRATKSSSFPGYTRILDSLPRAKRAGHNSGSHTRRSCFEGTRKAVLEDIDRWLDNPDPNTPPIFWLNGMAGIGKSTIAQTAADRTYERGLLGASFFFSRGDGELTDPSRVMPTLAFQLARFDQIFMHHIAAALGKDPDAGYLTLRQQLQKLIIAPLLPLVDNNRSVIHIVLDALDECDRSGAEELLHFSALTSRDFPLSASLLPVDLKITYFLCSPNNETMQR